MGWGGARVGAGRKPKDEQLLLLEGGRRRRRTGARADPPPAEHQPSLLEELPAPGALLANAAAVWDELAPLAMKKRTLTKAEVPGFQLLCENVALERQVRAGKMYGMPVGGSDHRGLIRMVEIGLARFGLNGTGKPSLIPEDEQPKDEWAEFDGLKVVQGGRP